jgi:galactose mutarotase-like enzyme
VAAPAIASIQEGGHAAIRISNGALQVDLVPALGAKIVSLFDRRSNREWLWRDPSRPYRVAAYGDDFADHDISGFDECFPSIGACAYPDEPWSGALIPDHGEVWSRPAITRTTPQSVVTTTMGVALPYEFQRELTLPSEDRIELTYTLRNLANSGMHYIWSAHPLFAAEPGMSVELPGTPALTKEFSIGGRIGDDAPAGTGYQGEYTWPLVPAATGATSDLRTLGFPRPAATDKVFAHRLDERWCRLVSADGRHTLTMRFDAPYLGICTNMAAWPDDGVRGRWIALEPCTARTDRLDVAWARGECALIEPRQTRRWTTSILLGTAEAARAGL